MRFLNSLFGASAQPTLSSQPARLGADSLHGLQPRFGKAEQILAEIDIDAAISAHENWKLRLHHYLLGTSLEVFQPQIVGLDNQSMLGQWLYGPGRIKFGHHPSFETLLARHKQFHLEAAHVVALKQAADLEGAFDVLNGNYARASRQVIWLLKSLKDNFHFLKSEITN